MATIYQLPRTSDAAVAPTTVRIATGELALNLLDKRLFTSNGTAVFDAVQNVAGDFRVGANIVVGTALAVGANVSLNLTSLGIGNSTVNTVVNSSAIVATGNVTAAYFVGNGAALTSVTATSAPAGSNTEIQFNDSGSTGASGNLAFDKTAGTLTVGNSTVNVVANSTQVTVGGVIANTSQIRVGANVTLATSRLLVGNSTVNSQTNSTSLVVTDATSTVTVNSSAIAAGANSILSTVALTLGNSTVNVAMNSTYGTFSNSTFIGYYRAKYVFLEQQPADGINAAYLDPTGLNIGNSTVYGWLGHKTMQVADATTGATVNTTVMTVGNSTVNVVVNTSAVAVGSNSLLTTAKAFVGNSTVNATVTSTSLVVTDATSTVTVNSSATSVGANVVLGTVRLFAGNSTVNSTMNSVSHVVTDATSTVTINSSAVAVGANVVVNATALTIGNSTVNVAINSSAIAVGANVVLRAESLSIGNSTVNVTANSSTLHVANAQITGGSVTGITDLTLADGGTGASLTDPNGDRIMFWDDSANSVAWLAPDGTTISISGTTISGTAAVSAATQAEMEAASSTTVYASPGRVKFHPGVAKGWVKAGITGNSIASYNVTSVTDTGTGQATVNWSTNFSSANYCPVAALTTGDGQKHLSIGTQAAGTTLLQAYSASDTLIDPTNYYCAAFGDQA